MDERYPSNSLVNRTAAEKPEEKKKPDIQPIVKEGVSKKKKGLGDKVSETFLVSDIKSVFSEMIFEVVIPSVKDAISELVRGTVDGMLFGGTRRGPSRRDRSFTKPYVSYRDSYDDRHRDIRDRRRPAASLVDDLTFSSRADAEDVRAAMLELIDEYQVASVKDLYSYAGLKSDFTMEKYGWYDLSDSTIRRVPEGWLLSLPKPKIIE